MSYQVLARKWRPRLFREMVGQTHVLQALINALDHNRLHHAYLFTGTRGVGKTTIARILAKCLNCDQGVSSEPCGVCSACREIDEGRFIDLIEVDAASRTKVEDTRELLEHVPYAPSRGRFKVYLIDEVHMLSGHSFNALLKTLEEPPEHVKFLLATTDPQKLPVTVLSRCLQFSLKNMLPEKVVEYLRHVLAEEQIPFDEESLWALGRAADGSMRDGLSLTDQAIAFGNGQLRVAEVRSMLGTIDQGQVFELLGALASGDARGMLAAVAELAEQGADFAGVLAELISTLQSIAIAQVLPEAADNAQGDRQRVLELAGRISAEDVQLFYQLALHGRRDLPLAPDPRGGFEMAMLRMLAFRPGTLQHTGPTAPGAAAPPAPTQGNPPPPAEVASGKPAGISQARPDSTADRPAAHAVPAAAVAASAPVDESAAEPAVAVAVALQPEPAPPPVAPRPEPVPPPAPEQPPVESAPEVSAAQIPAPPAEPAHEVDDEPPEWLQGPPPDDSYDPDDGDAGVAPYLGDWQPAEEPDAPQTAAGDEVSDLPPATGLAARWLEIFPSLGVAGLTQSIGAHCQLVAIEGAVWRLHLDPGHSGLYNENHRQRLQTALGESQGQPLTIEVLVQAPDQETPAVAAARRRVARQQEAEASIHSDPLVQVLINDFAAQICADSIRPIDA